MDKQTRGVFVTRSPLRPNHIGISIVNLTGVEGNKPFVKGIDIFDGTPLLDIKPYIGKFDAVQDSVSGWLQSSDKEIRKNVLMKDSGNIKKTTIISGSKIFGYDLNNVQRFFF
jgi:tRNA (Thr-GGU) A37 N-methylase